MNRRKFIGTTVAAALVADRAGATPVTRDPFELRRAAWERMSDEEKCMAIFGRPDPASEIVPSPMVDDFVMAAYDRQVAEYDRRNCVKHGGGAGAS